MIRISHVQSLCLRLILFSGLKNENTHRANGRKSVRADLGQNDPTQFRQVETVLLSLLELKSISMLIHKVSFGYSTKVAYVPRAAHLVS